MTHTEPVTLTVSGDLTVETVPALLASIEQACQGGGANLVLNLNSAQNVDSHGLGAIIRGLKIARDAGGNLVIGSASHEVAHMMSLTGLDQLVPVGA